MAEQRDQETAGGRYVLLIALAALALATALSFGRVFRGDDATFKLAVAGVAAVALAWLLERRHVVLAAVVSAVGLAVGLGLLVFPATTRLGLPTLATWRAVTGTLGAVGRTADSQVAPTLPLAPLMLAAVTAQWSACFASHALASRARSPLLALTPPAALVAFASIVMEDGARPGYVVLFLAAALAVMFADGLRRVGQWGPVTMWHGRRSLRFGSSTNTRGARLVGVACLAAAAFIPWMLPGFRGQAILDLDQKGAPLHVSVDPIVDIRPTLVDNPNVQYFTVRTTGNRAAYWRTLTLDTFTGRLWTSSNLEATGGASFGNSPVAYPVDLSGLDPVSAVLIHQRVIIDRLSQLWLPAAPDPTHISVERSAIRYDANTATMVAPNASYPGFSYDVTSTQVVPTPDDLEIVFSLSGPRSTFYTALPRNMPPQIFQIAHRLTDGQPNVYRKILAIQQYLRNFRYDLHVQPGHGANDILHFLTQTKAGYCEQFAGTMAVLLRALRIPTRVAVGFTPGRFDARDQAWHVSGGNAHAWVEVLFPGYGWLAFEPTPGRANPVARPYAEPAFALTPLGGQTQCPGPPGTCAGDQAGTGGNQTSGGSINGHKDPKNFELPPDKRGLIGAGPREGSPGAQPDRNRYAMPALVGLGGLIALFLILTPMAKRARRRWMLVRADTPRDRVLAAYRAMVDEATDLGIGRRAAETLEEYRQRLTGQVPSLDGDLDGLTSMAGRAAYSEDPVPSEAADRAVSSARRVARDMRRATDARTRLRSWYRLDRPRSRR
jgi:transglutaminase-like putative cysteine protease